LLILRLRCATPRRSAAEPTDLQRLGNIARMPAPDPALTIRPARADDADVIADFNIRMARETEDLALDPATVGRGVRAALADPAKALYFVAEGAGQVVGQLMITHEWSDWRDGDLWWVQSVYVAPEFRRRGVFAALYRHVERAAREQKVAGIRLYVDEHNAVARDVYGRLGMRVSNYRVMEFMFGQH
jgi:ribosomal protein S18 acetylase RimI-like enzyme